MGQYCDLLLDDSNIPHISYHDGNSGSLKYAVWDGSQWQVTVVDSAGFVGTYTSLCQTPDKTIHILYRDEENKKLKHAWNSVVPTPTPVPGMDFTFDLGPDASYSGGDWMDGTLAVTNHGAARALDVYVLLEVAGQFWFGPGWTPGADHFDATFTAGESRDIQYLPGFNLPDPMPASGPFHFYAAGFEDGSLTVDTLISNVAIKTFSFL